MIIAAIVGALITVMGNLLLPTATAIAGKIFNGDSEMPKIEASSILAPDDLPDTIKANEAGVNVKGKLPQSLPSGQQIWVTTRQSAGVSTDGIGGPGFAVSELCDVGRDSKTFDCGLSQLGSDPERGSDRRPLERYAVYVGIADSSTARELVRIRVEQEADNWSHTVPPGFNSLPPQIVERKLH